MGRRFSASRSQYSYLIEEVRTRRGSASPRRVFYCDDLTFRLRLSPSCGVETQAAAAGGRLKDEAIANQRLGRLKEQNWRASQAIDVSRSPDRETVARAVNRSGNYCTTWRCQ